MTSLPTSSEGDVERNVVADVDADVLVVGAGFGGLGAAFSLVEGGPSSRASRVVVCEALTYPGGCAGSFRKDGYGFDAGATLGAGFGKGQLFRRWVDECGLSVATTTLDPVIEFRTADRTIPIYADRARFVDHMCAIPGAPQAGVRAFYAEQRIVADTMWSLLDDPELLPPLSGAAVLRHLLRAPRYGRLVRWARRPVLDVLRSHGVADFEPLRALVDALCRITVQCGVDEAEAPVALATLDYCWRGAVHVEGGMGALARALADGFSALGGEMRYATRVKRLTRESGRWTAETNRGLIRVDTVVANLLPQTLRRILGDPVGKDPALDTLAGAVETGWGAAMLFLVLRSDPALPASATHMELVDDAGAALIEGNHVFLSVSRDGEPGRAPAGFRTATASTHLPLRELRGLPQDQQVAAIERAQVAMRRTIALRAPEWNACIVAVHTASPRTFERFTFREGGWVGGVPRRAGLANYRGLSPTEVRPRLFIVGDSVFPGQSTLAAAIGGTRVAEAIRRRAVN